MVSKQEFERVCNIYKNKVGEESFNKVVNERIVNGVRQIDALMKVLTGVGIRKEIKEVFDRFEQDKDLYLLLTDVTKNFVHFKIPNEYYVEKWYEEMKKRI